MKALAAGMVLALLPIVSLAQCPAGLTPVGSLYAEDNGSIGKEAKVPAGTMRAINLPENLALDTSYQQKNFTAAGGYEAKSQMTTSQVPAGFNFDASGSTRNGCAGWSVSNPKQLIVKRDGSRIIQEGIQMNLYCHSGSGEVCKDGTGCNVKVDVCAKQMSN